MIGDLKRSGEWEIDQTIKPEFMSLAYSVEKCTGFLKVITAR